MKTQIGFIGGGRITRIILQAFKNRDLPLEHIAVSEIDPEAANRLKSQFPNISLADAKAAASRDFVFIALHPPAIMEMLDQVKSSVREGAVVVSLAPKISLDKIASVLGKAQKIVRLIPNATSYINEGYNPVAFGAGILPEEKGPIMDMLQLMGTTFEVQEKKLEAYAIVSAMAPTYFWFQWQVLSDIGQQIGMNKEESDATVYRTLRSALDLQFGSGLSPEEVMDLIPVKPIGEHESDISQIFHEKLMVLHEKIQP